MIVTSQFNRVNNPNLKSEADVLDHVRRYLRRYVNLQHPRDTARIASHVGGVIEFTIHDARGEMIYLGFMPDDPRQIRRHWADGSPVQGGGR